MASKIIAGPSTGQSSQGANADIPAIIKGTAYGQQNATENSNPTVVPTSSVATQSSPAAQSSYNDLAQNYMNFITSPTGRIGNDLSNLSVDPQLLTYADMDNGQINGKDNIPIPFSNGSEHISGADIMSGIGSLAKGFMQGYEGGFASDANLGNIINSQMQAKQYQMGVAKQKEDMANSILTNYKSDNQIQDELNVHDSAVDLNNMLDQATNKFDSKGNPIAGNPISSMAVKTDLTNILYPQNKRMQLGVVSGDILSSQLGFTGKLAAGFNQFINGGTIEPKVANQIANAIQTKVNQSASTFSNYYGTYAQRFQRAGMGQDIDAYIPNPYGAQPQVDDKKNPLLDKSGNVIYAPSNTPKMTTYTEPATGAGAGAGAGADALPKGPNVTTIKGNIYHTDPAQNGKIDAYWDTKTRNWIDMK